MKNMEAGGFSPHLGISRGNKVFPVFNYDIKWWMSKYKGGSPVNTGREYRIQLLGLQVG